MCTFVEIAGFLHQTTKEDYEATNGGGKATKEVNETTKANQKATITPTQTTNTHIPRKK